LGDLAGKPTALGSVFGPAKEGYGRRGTAREYWFTTRCMPSHAPSLRRHFGPSLGCRGQYGELLCIPAGSRMPDDLRNRALGEAGFRSARAAQSGRGTVRRVEV